jgi:hypothetical protein
VENPLFAFLGGSAGAVATAGVAAAAPPAVSAARAGTSATRVASLVSCLAAGAPAPAPGTVSSAASRIWARGARAPTSLGEPGPHRFPLPPPRPTTSTSRSRGRRALLLTQPELHTPPFPTLPSPDAPLLLARRPLLLSPLRRARACSGSGSGRVGPHGVHGPYLQKSRQGLKTRRYPANRQNKGRWKSTHQWADWEHGQRPEGRIVSPGGPEVDGAPRPCGCVLPRGEVRHLP